MITLHDILTSVLQRDRVPLLALKKQVVNVLSSSEKKKSSKLACCKTAMWQETASSQNSKKLGPSVQPCARNWRLSTTTWAWKWILPQLRLALTSTLTTALQRSQSTHAGVPTQHKIPYPNQGGSFFNWILTANKETYAETEIAQTSFSGQRMEKW